MSARKFKSIKDSHLTDLIQAYIPVQSPVQRFKMLVEYSLGAVKEPTRADYVAAVGDLSSTHVLRDIRRKMM